MIIQIFTFSLKENVFENDVCKIAAILSRPQYVNPGAANVRHSNYIPMIQLVRALWAMTTLHKYTENY